MRPSPKTALGRMIATKAVVHIADIAADQRLTQNNAIRIIVAAVELGGVRTFLAVPMLKENELIGVFTLPPGGPPLYRQADRVGHKLRCPSRHRH